MYMVRIPDDVTIKYLHKKYSPSEIAFNRVFSHCEIVADICSILSSDTVKFNYELARAGALLHDIGAYKFITAEGKFFNKDTYVQHALFGYEILRSEGFDDSICRFAKNHTGVGITKSEIQNNHIPLPADDYLAETVEEKLVMYADKFHSKTPIFHSFETARTYFSKFSDSQRKQELFDEFAETFGKPDVESLAEKYTMPID